MTSLPRADSAHPQLPQARFDQANGVLETRQGDTTVLLDVNGGRYGVAVPAIVERLQDVYDVAPETLAADSAALIDRLFRAKLIRLAGP